MKKIAYMLILCICLIGMTGCGNNANEKKANDPKQATDKKCSESYNCDKNSDGNYDCLYSKYDTDNGYDFDNEEKIVCSENQISTINTIHEHD